MTDPVLEFESKSHTYRYEGAVVPGVTTVLNSVGISDFSMVPPEILAQAQALGTEVHTACENHLKNEPQSPNLSDVSGLRLCHFISFLNDYDIEVIDVEKKVHCKSYGYAGTMDLVAVSKKIVSKGTPFIVDYKTGKSMRAHKIQTAAYERAYPKDKRTWWSRYCLYLNDEGYTLSPPQKAREDFGVFLSALNVHNYKLGAK